MTLLSLDLVSAAKKSSREESMSPGLNESLPTETPRSDGSINFSRKTTSRYSNERQLSPTPVTIVPLPTKAHLRPDDSRSRRPVSSITSDTKSDAPLLRHSLTASHSVIDDATCPGSSDAGIREGHTTPLQNKKCDETDGSRVKQLGETVTQIEEKPTCQDEDGDPRAKGKRRMKLYKAGFVSAIFGIKYDSPCPIPGA